MLALVFFVAVSAAISVMALLLRVTAELLYEWKDGESLFRIHFRSLFNLLRYDYVSRPSDNRTKNKKKAQDKRKTEEKEGNGLERFLKSVSNVHGYYSENRKVIADARRYLEGRLSVKEYSLTVREGTGDAAETGILAGLAWTLGGVVTSFILRHIKPDRVKTQVTPVYNEKQLHISLHCIFVLRFVHIIVMILKLYFNHLRKRNQQKRKRKMSKNSGKGGGVFA